LICEPIDDSFDGVVTIQQRRKQGEEAPGEDRVPALGQEVNGIRRDDLYMEVFFEHWFFYHGNYPVLQR